MYGQGNNFCNYVRLNHVSADLVSFDANSELQLALKTDHRLKDELDTVSYTTKSIIDIEERKSEFFRKFREARMLEIRANHRANKAAFNNRSDPMDDKSTLLSKWAHDKKIDQTFKLSGLDLSFAEK